MCVRDSEKCQTATSTVELLEYRFSIRNALYLEVNICSNCTFNNGLNSFLIAKQISNDFIFGLSVVLVSESDRLLL